MAYLHINVTMCKLWYFDSISLIYFPNGPNNNTPELLLIINWSETGDKSLSEATIALFVDVLMYHPHSIS